MAQTFAKEKCITTTARRVNFLSQLTSSSGCRRRSPSHRTTPRFVSSSTSFCSEVSQRIFNIFPTAHNEVSAESWLRYRNLRTLHVTSVIECDNQYYTIRVDAKDAPKSNVDAFMLDLSRTLAQAVITSAEILRTEPLVSTTINHEILRAYRRDVLNNVSESPIPVVLTRSGILPHHHPMYEMKSAVVVFCSARTIPDELRRLCNSRLHLELHHCPNASLRDAIQYIRKQKLCSRISVEAGPLTTQCLYTLPIYVDGILLAQYHGPLTDHVVGITVNKATLDSSFKLIGESRHADWSFRLFIRQA